MTKKKIPIPKPKDIKKLAEQFGGSRKLAEAMGLSIKSIQNWGSGNQKIPKGRYEQIAALMAGEKPPAPKPVGKIEINGRLKPIHFKQFADALGTNQKVASYFGLHPSSVATLKKREPTPQKHLEKAKKLAEMLNAGQKPAIKSKKATASKQNAEPLIERPNGKFYPGHIVALRDALGSDRLLAEQVGVHPGTICNWRHAEKLPPQHYLPKIQDLWTKFITGAPPEEEQQVQEEQATDGISFSIHGQVDVQIRGGNLVLGTPFGTITIEPVAQAPVLSYSNNEQVNLNRLRAAEANRLTRRGLMGEVYRG